MKKILLLLKSQSKVDCFLNMSFLVGLFASIASIPICSFNKKILFVTWICFIFMLSIVLIKLLIKEIIIINKVIVISFGLLTLSMLFSSLINLNGAFTFTPFLLIAIIVLLNIFFSSFPELRKSSFFISYAALLAFLLVFIFVYRKELISHDFFRLGTVFGDQNEMAMFLSLGAGFSIFIFLFYKQKIIKIFSVPLFILFLYAGFSTGSKLFIFTLSCCSTFLIFCFFKKRWWLSVLVIALIIAIAFILLNLPAFSNYKTRLLGFFNFFSPVNNESGDFSTYERFNMFLAGIHMFETKPIFGFGNLGFSQLSSFGKGAHNTIVQMLCNYGLVGFTLFFSPFIYSFKCFYKFKKTNASIISLMIVLFFLFCTFSLYLDIQKIYAVLIPLAYSELTQHDSHNYKLNIKEMLSKTKHDSHDKIRVCFVLSNFGLGGPQEVVKNIILSMNSNKFDIHVVYFYNNVNEKYQNFIENNHFNFHCLNKKAKGFSLSFLLRMRKVLKEIDPDIFSTHSSCLIYTYLLNMFNNKRIIHTIHSLPHLDQPKPIRFLIRRAIKDRKIVLVGCSSKIAELATDLYSNNVIPINNGVFIPKNIELEEKKYDFITIGRLVSMKRIDLILDAFKKINQNNCYNLAIIGDGPEKEFLIKKVKSENIRGVSFLGEVSDVSRILKISKIHLMASEWEGNPMSILESMAFGIPTISSDVGGVSDIVTNNFNGFLYSYNDVSQFINCIFKLLDNDIYLSLSKNCMKESFKFNVKSTAKKYEDLFSN